MTETAPETPRRRLGLDAVLARPELLIAGGLVLLVCIYQLRPTPGNPPGLHRDEVSIAYNAWTLSQHLRDQSGSYVTGFSALIAFAVAGAIAVWLLPRRRHDGHQPVVLLQHA